MKVDLSKTVNNKKITPIEEQVLEYIINNIDSVMELDFRGGLLKTTHPHQLL
ncbi:hypothetical protein [Clostridium beijerinckii]|uniref:hypothetical protein n=1 Tax=Clostridium beijerinckii TaxID=1520 RepID=UPI001F4C17F8|nr:hypothetical protein [Clostridium beijerinckii]NRT74466.1 hypothetical protein [Clostridium beijerinckii]